MDAYIEERYRSETRRLVAGRGLFGASAFAIGVGVAGLLEITYHPERLGYLVLVFTLELAVCLVTNACFRSRRLRRYGIRLTSGACVALVGCVTLYGTLTAVNHSALALLFIVFELTTPLMFPWGAGSQGNMAIACLLAQSSLVLRTSGQDETQLIVYELYAVAVGGLLSVLGAAFLDRQRRTVFAQREQLDRHLATFRDLTRTLHGFDPQRVLSVVCASTLETFRLRRLWVMWQALGRGSVEGYLVRHTGTRITWEPLADTGPFWRWVTTWRSGGAAFLADGAAENAPPALRGARAGTMLCMPLGDGGEQLGAICGDRAGEPLSLSERELALATVLASGTAIAITNASLYEQVIAASAEKSEFLARIAHELRNPLQTILWDVDALRESVEGEQPQLERVRQNSMMTLDLATELQEFAEVENRRLTATPEAINLPQALDQLESTAAGLLDGRPIAFRTMVEPGAAVVVTDPFRLRQILTNLISNAAKFTARGAIEVEARPLGTEIAISVRDTGIGIAARDLAHVFTPFYRGSTRGLTGTRGMGLGLAISQELATLLGGRLEVESTVGEGSTFRLVLPADVTSGLAEPADDTTPLRGAVVLLVDDDARYRDHTATLLRRSGADVIEASEGFEGLRHAREGRPDVIILDLGLPGLSGLQVLAHLKRDRQLGEVPVVVATAEGDLETRCREAGCAAWIAKPFAPSELLRVLTAIVRGADEHARARPS
jgi:signal transduction histidine kinase/CheY-like chemotaxis protein